MENNKQKREDIEQNIKDLIYKFEHTSKQYLTYLLDCDKLDISQIDVYSNVTQNQIMTAILEEFKRTYLTPPRGMQKKNKDKVDEFQSYIIRQKNFML